MFELIRTQGTLGTVTGFTEEIKLVGSLIDFFADEKYIKPDGLENWKFHDGAVRRQIQVLVLRYIPPQEVMSLGSYYVAGFKPESESNLKPVYFGKMDWSPASEGGVPRYSLDGFGLVNSDFPYRASSTDAIRIMMERTKEAEGVAVVLGPVSQDRWEFLYQTLGNLPEAAEFLFAQNRKAHQHNAEVKKPNMVPWLAIAAFLVGYLIGKI